MVSVVIPNYNKGSLICKSLDSLLNQTVINWEAIIVDDCSTDDSWEIINRYVGNDRRFSAYRNAENRGGCYSRNFGAKQAKGEYLIFLDSDDWLAADCLERRVAEMQKPEKIAVDMLISPMGTVKDGVQTGQWIYHGGDPLLSLLRHEIPWSIMMPTWRRGAFERIGGFDESYPRLQDVELHTRALIQGVRVVASSRKDADCFYYIEEGRMTTNHQCAAEVFVRAVSMYVAKMRDLIVVQGGLQVGQRLSALRETVFQAYRNLGDLRQAGRLSRADEKRLREILLQLDRSCWSGVYRMAYDLNLNRFKGFNFLFRKCYRLLGR